MTAGPTGWDADLGDALAAGLLGPAPGNLAAFEAAFMRHVEAGHHCPEKAWDAFYDATLARVGSYWDASWSSGPSAGTGTVATFSRIWARAAALAHGHVVLDVGSCFGFLPLAWSGRPDAPALLALELSPAAAVLLARQAGRLARPVAVLCADGGRLPIAEQAVDTVLVLHVLEHLVPATADRLLAEALRAARRRVVVAVPLEDRPDPVFGHVQNFDLPALAALGASTGWACDVRSGDGGWLVLDRRHRPG